MWGVYVCVVLGVSDFSQMFRMCECLHLCMSLFVLLGVPAIACSHLERRICAFSPACLCYFVSKCESCMCVFYKYFLR